VIVESPRGKIWAIAIVTERIKPLRIQDKIVHVVGLPWHFGWRWPEDGSGGDSANLLTPCVGDPNTVIPSTKVFLLDIKKM